MDQVERALLVVSGDAASSKLAADSQVSPLPSHAMVTEYGTKHHALIAFAMFMSRSTMASSMCKDIGLLSSAAGAAEIQCPIALKQQHQTD